MGPFSCFVPNFSSSRVCRHAIDTYNWLAGNPERVHKPVNPQRLHTYYWCTSITIKLTVDLQKSTCEKYAHVCTARLLDMKQHHISDSQSTLMKWGHLTRLRRLYCTKLDGEPMACQDAWQSRTLLHVPHPGFPRRLQTDSDNTSMGLEMQAVCHKGLLFFLRRAAWRMSFSTTPVSVDIPQKCFTCPPCCLVLLLCADATPM